MEIYYFTGTGNSLYIAKKIKENFIKCSLIPIETLLHLEKITPKSKEVGFVFPVYFGDIPKFIKRIIKKFDFSNVEYIFVIPNCYSIAGATFINLKKILKTQNKNINYENILFMPDNAILFPIEKDYEKLKQVEKDIILVIEDIKKKTNKRLSTNYFQILQYYFMKLFSNWEFSPKKFIVNNSCISCGICKQVCPTKNIEIKYGKPIFNSNCTHCLACFHWCPKEAISIKNFTIKNRRKYHNPNVELNEIIRKK